MQTHTNDHLKSRNQFMIENFMRSARQPVPVRPTMPDLQTRQLRARLMLEEVLETINVGLGIEVRLRAAATDGKSPPNVTIEETVFVVTGPGDLIQVADGCADVEVVTVGTAAACGIAHQPCFELVAGNNMMKFAPGHEFRSDGKLVKPPNHPNIDRDLQNELIRQGAPGE